MITKQMQKYGKVDLQAVMARQSPAATCTLHADLLERLPD